MGFWFFGQIYTEDVILPTFDAFKKLYTVDLTEIKLEMWILVLKTHHRLTKSLQIPIVTKWLEGSWNRITHPPHKKDLLSPLDVVRMHLCTYWVTKISEGRPQTDCFGEHAGKKNLPKTRMHLINVSLQEKEKNLTSNFQFSKSSHPQKEGK